MFRKIIPFLLILILLIACQTAEEEINEPHLVADWQATAPASRTPLPTLTPIPTATGETIPPTVAPMTFENTPEPLPTIAPTEIPPFVYLRESDGLTIPYPDTWTVEEDSVGVIFDDPDFGIRIIVDSDFIDPESGFDDFVEVIIDDFEVGFEIPNLVVIEEEEGIPFAVEHTAQSALIATEGATGNDLGIKIVYGEIEPRAYYFIVIGTLTDLAAREHTIGAMTRLMTTGGSRLFGLERDETLVLLGGDPFPSSLDPALQTGSAAGYIGLLYSGLVKLDPNLQVVPDLAENWQVNEDGTVYTFTLRDGLAFADGTKLTTQHIVDSWERAADPDTDSTTARTYLGDILGVNEKLDGDADTISGLEIVDDRTLVVTLDAPKSYFLVKLSYPTSYVLDLNSVDKDDEEWVFSPNPSGPYLLDEFKEGEAMIFMRNDEYHNPVAIPNVVYLSSRVGSRISLYQSGEVDWVYLGVTDAEQVQDENHELHEDWVSAISMCTSVVQVNNLLPPMDDPNVRLAFALAVDREGLNELLTEGTDPLAYTILPPAMPGHSLALEEERQETAAFNPDAARAALAASSYADDMPTVVFSASGFGDTERDDLNFMIQDWREVLGVEVEIQLVDPENFSDSVGETQGHFVDYGWCADYPDPENFLDVLYHSGSEFNVAGYENGEIDALLEEARSELDGGTRLALYQQIERMLLEDTAVIPLSNSISDVLVNPKLEGFVLAPIGVQIIPFLSFNDDLIEEQE